MHLLKCENGHIYDTDKFRSCPHCSCVDFGQLIGADTFGEYQSEVETEIPDAAVRRQMRIGKTVGLLLCVAGEMCGEGFLLHEGENTIGRAANMDVALVRESTISRKNHAGILYHAKGNTYILSTELKNADVTLNGKRVTSQSVLKDRDRIRLGACELVFIEAGSVWQGNKHS